MLLNRTMKMWKKVIKAPGKDLDLKDVFYIGPRGMPLIMTKIGRAHV